MSRTFSFAARIASFGHALRGLAEVVATQHNAWIHAAATIAACALAALLGISAGEWLAVVLAISSVWTAEALNTDVAAGAVLVSATGAATVGLVVFAPRLLHLVR